MPTVNRPSGQEASRRRIPAQHGCATTYGLRSSVEAAQPCCSSFLRPALWALAFIIVLLTITRVPQVGIYAAPGDPEEQIHQTDEEEKSVLRELFNYELDLMVVNQQLTQTEDKIRQLEISHTNAAKALTASERKMSERRDLIRKRLRFLYEDGRVSYLEVLLQATSFSDLISRFELIQTVIIHDVQILKETQAIRVEISRRAQALAEQQQLVALEKETLAAKKEEVQTVIAQRESYLRGLREKRAYYEGLVDDIIVRWNEQIMPEITKLAYNIGYVVSDPDIIKEAETQVTLLPPGINVSLTDTVLNKRLWAKDKALTPFQITFEEGQVIIQRDLDYELRVSGCFELDDKQQIVFTVSDMTLDGMAISENLRQTLFRGMKVSFNPTALPMKLKVSDFIAKPGTLTVRMR